MAIVETWYAWTQEFFCDAVGFFMAGPAFAYAFSMYFRTLGWKEYYVPEEELAGRSRPVTWMRIHLLADRARQIGYEDIANDLEEKWQQAAEALGIVSKPTAISGIGSVKPRNRTAFQLPSRATECRLAKFWDEPEDYRAWEENAIAGFLETQT